MVSKWERDVGTFEEEQWGGGPTSCTDMRSQCGTMPVPVVHRLAGAFHAHKIIYNGSERGLRLSKVF